MYEKALPSATRHTETTWNVRTSEALEAIAFLNALTGDPLAAPHYAAELRHRSTCMTVMKAGECSKRLPPAWPSSSNSWRKRVLRQRTPHGYNRWPEYVAENAVRALEQRIGEDLGLGPRWTWREDGGMHTLACVLYTAMREEGFPRQEEGFQDFLRRTVAEDLLAAGHVEAQYGRVCRNR
jgi:hypothetical protein